VKQKFKENFPSQQTIYGLRITFQAGIIRLELSSRFRLLEARTIGEESVNLEYWTRHELLPIEPYNQQHCLEESKLT